MHSPKSATEVKQYQYTEIYENYCPLTHTQLWGIVSIVVIVYIVILVISVIVVIAVI